MVRQKEKNVFIGSSLKHRKGVFAKKDFKKGEIILDIDDTHIVKDEKSLPSEEKNHCDYLGDKIVLMHSPEVYINHSCEPNTYIKTIDNIRRVIAMRDIQNKEEITADYAINGYYDSNEICNCGSRRCRGIVNPNFFRLPPELQKEYLPYLDHWFVKKFKNEIKGLKITKK